MGGVLAPEMDWSAFIIQFVNVHLLLFGGATAFNSYWDKDEGPVGGLKNPPSMTRWMWFASILLQALGLLVAVLSGFLFVFVYVASMILFWLYSSPVTRWKAYPVKSLMVIGISTGTNSMLMGYLAAGQSTPGSWVLLASAGTALVILSLYPTSQIYQLEQDKIRGDQTFAVKYGIKGVKNFFTVSYAAGILLLLPALLQLQWWIGFLFGAAGFISGMWIQFQLNSLTVHEEDYWRVMKIKYGTSLAFVCVLTLFLIWKHTSLV